jgi:hypothetical protein
MRRLVHHVTDDPKDGALRCVTHRVSSYRAPEMAR